MNLWVEALTVLIEIILLLYFFSNFFKSRKHFGILQYAFVLIYGFILFLISYYLPVSVIHILITIISTLCLVKLLFKESWPTVLYSSFLFCVSTILIDVFCGAILKASGFSTEDLIGDGSARIIYNSMAMLFRLLVLYIILQSTNHRYEKAALVRSLPLLSCLIFSFITCYINFLSLMDGAPPTAVLLETLGLLYINILICAYVEILNRTYMKQKEAELAKQQLEVREAYYHDMVARQEETRALWHDIKKYMMAMETLVGHENQEEARRCLEEIHASFAGIQNTVDTGNTIIDGILAYGMKKAAKAGVTIKPSVWLDNSLHIPASDLFVIIGNTMDNAIEACSALPEETERIVSISLNQKNHLLSYEISNPYQPGRKKKRGRIHGYGLRNVETLVDKNGGNMTITKDEQQFIVSVCLNV